MKTNRLKKLGTFGQSIWLDYIRRDLIAGGQLRRLIDEDGLRGMTSNPSIFEKAIVESHEYDDDIRAMALEGKEVITIYEALSQHDVQCAADEFRPLYDKTDGRDGYVSLEVNPHLAHDAKGTIEEGRRLWGILDRPNVFIKVPATTAGLSAIQELTSDGINVNVTLLFGLPRYRQVADAYLTGLAARLAHGKPVNHVVSVASFFVSRIDSLVDPLLAKIIAQGGEKANLAKTLRGQAAIASAKVAYQIYKEIVGSERFKTLADQGARVQRLLWASTSTKNPNDSDVKYIEALIGPDTVNTVPLNTLDAYRDHGDPNVRLTQDVEKARLLLEQLSEVGISIDQVTQQLEDDGVAKFNKPFDQLMETLAQEFTAAKRAPADPQAGQAVSKSQQALKAS
ncbi:MAG: Transaldolase [Nitrospira sp.]|jgi:transaldolase|nr:MAG: Transaldolase [Nitrospira sp.]